MITSNQLSSAFAVFLYTALDATASGEPTYHQFLSRHLPSVPEVHSNSGCASRRLA